MVRHTVEEKQKFLQNRIETKRCNDLFARAFPAGTISAGGPEGIIRKERRKRLKTDRSLEDWETGLKPVLEGIIRENRGVFPPCKWFIADRRDLSNAFKRYHGGYGKVMKRVIAEGMVAATPKAQNEGGQKAGREAQPC